MRRVIMCMTIALLMLLSISAFNRGDALDGILGGMAAGWLAAFLPEAKP